MQRLFNKNKVIIFTLVFLIVSIFNLLYSQNSSNTQSIKQLKFSYINIFFVSAVYDGNNVHLVWDEYNKSGEKISETFIEKTIDGINWQVLASKPTFNLFDIHVNGYPSDIQAEGAILYSTETGKGRFIYNDVCESGDLDNPLIRYRVGFKTADEKYFYTSEIDANSGSSASGIRIASPDEYVVSDTVVVRGKVNTKPPIITTKTACPNIGSPISGSTNTGQQQTFYGTCCTWTETLYTLPSTFQIVCGGGSYAWCCNNVSSTVSCPSYYWWDPCCIHTCSEFGYCTCHPWNCCTMIPGQNIWVVTSSTTFTGFQVNTQVTHETCPNYTDGSIVLTPVGGTAPYSYSWAGGQTSSALYFLSAGNYSCTVYDAYGCSVPLSIDITSNPVPVANAGVDQTICSGGNAILTASGGVGYLWNNSSTSQTITVSPLSTQTYTVTVANSYGCTAKDDVVVNVYDITSPFTVTTPICLEKTATVTYTGNATSAATYNWNFNGGNVISGSGAGPLEVQWSSGGVHNITLIVNEPGCNLSSQTVMSVNVVDVTAVKIENNPLCFGSDDGSVTVVAGGGQSPYTYLWSPGNHTTSSISNIPQGSYIVTITDNMGCIEIDTLTLTDPPKLVASVVNINPVSCFGGSNGSITVSATGGTASFNYNWSPVAGSSNILSGLSVGTYYVTITDANSCSDSTFATVTQPDSLIAFISDSVNILCNGASTGKATVSVIGGVMPYTYQWNSTPVQNNASANNIPAGTYTVTVTDANGCTAHSFVTLEQPPALSIVSTPKNENCKGDCNGEIQVNVNGGTPSYSYLWNTSPVQTNSTATNLCIGLWKVTVTDANGCTIKDSATIYTNSPIIAMASANPLTGFVPVSISFFFTGSGASTYLWNFGDGNTSTDQNPIHTFTTAGMYNIVLTVNSGIPDFCTDTYAMTLTFENPSSVFIPNIFTPNGDGYNDVFRVESVSMAEENMVIYNRWGKKVYEWNNLGGVWDGENNSDGTYYYIYTGKGRDKVEYNYHGTVTLLRSKH